MKYNSIGQQLIAKAKELDPSYKPDKFNDMSEALNIILNNLDTYATFNDLHTLDIGNITSSSNIYQTLYQNIYENDTTKKNVVIFSTEGFVDSATSLISSGEHIATPYQDNKILIDSVFVLNSDNSATSIVSSDTVVIDLTSDGSLNSIASLYRKINNSQSLNFSNQSAVYNNIATAINNGLVPILKFADGYGYYKEYLSSSSEYVFTLNHITNPELATNPANNVITLKIGNTTNKCYYNNLSQIPTTVVISSGAFGDSGSLTSAESKNLTKLLTTAQYNLSAGIFILNNVDKKIYYVTESKSGNFNTLMAYTINQNSVEVLNFTYSRGVFKYTKTTYPLGGRASKMLNLGNLTDEGTLDAGKFQELITLYQNGDLIQVIFDYKVGAYITACAYSNDTSMGIVAYDVSNSLNAINLSLNLTNGNYTITPIVIPTSFKTINGQTILGSGDLPITADITYATDDEVNNLFTNPGQAIPEKTISLENLNAFKQQIDNEIGQVLEEGF